MMAYAMRLMAAGGVEQMQWQEVAVPAPDAGDVTLRHTAVGLNFIDVYHRTGLYPQPCYPCGLGMEAAGVVEAVGEGVDHLKVGDRVAYMVRTLGAYSERRTMEAERVVRIPDAVSDEQAAAVMLKGMTVWYLVTRTYAVTADTTMLVHAAAGGVGTLLCQWARDLGATVIGTAGSAEKAALARAHGATHVVEYKREDIVQRVRALTDGVGVDVVYDSVGKDTFTASLDSLKPLGLMVSYGNASGPLPPINALELTKRGSLFFTRPGLVDYTRLLADYRAAAEAVFARVADGRLQVEIGQRFALRDAAAAHKALEAGATMGATVLTV